MDRPGLDDALPDTDIHSSDHKNSMENGAEGYRSDHDQISSIPQPDSTKEVGERFGEPDSTLGTSEQPSVMPDERPGMPYAPNNDDTAGPCVQAHVHQNGDVAHTSQGVGPKARPSQTAPGLSRGRGSVLSRSWHGEDLTPPAVIPHDVEKARSMTAKTDGPASGVVHTSVSGGGDDDEGDGASKRHLVQQVVGEKERSAGEDEGSRRLLYRLIGSTVTVTLFYITAYLSITPILSQYLVRRSAVEHFNLTNVSLKQTPCAHGDNSSVQDDINWLQAQTSQRLFYYNVTQCIPAIFVALLVGSYADYFGRKLLVMVPLFGGFLKSLVILLVIYLDLDTRFFFLAFSLDGLLGSFYIIMLGLFAAIADVTFSTRQRVLMFAMLEISLAVGGAGSQIGTGFLIDALGFVVPSLVMTGLFILACFCAVVLMPETLHSRPEQLVLNPLVHLRKVFGFYFFDGTYSQRSLFILGQFVLFIVSMVNLGRLTVETLYEINSPFCWDSIRIGIFTGVRMLLQNLGGVLILKVLTKCIRIELIGMLGILSGMAGFILEALAKTDLMMYISGVVGMLIPVVPPVARGLLSRMVPAESQGALFASLSAVETLCTLTASIVLNNVYTVTLDFWPGAVFILIAALLLLDLILLIIFTLVSRKFPHFQEVQIEVKNPDSGASPLPSPASSQVADESTRLLSNSNCIERHASYVQSGDQLTGSPRRSRSFIY